jgi:hypothetical protein
VITSAAAVPCNRAEDYRTHIGQNMTMKPAFGCAATVRQSSLSLARIFFSVS